MAKYGIPYMGSKSDIADKIMRLIPQCENFYDLFGGGFAVTHAAIAHKKASNYFYNEIQSDIIDLIQKAISGFYSYQNFLQPFVSREEFFEKKDTDPYVRIVWSFGNPQDAYLYGKEIESYKRSIHNAVVFDEFDETAKLALGISSWPFGVKSIHKKTLVVHYLVKKISHKNGLASYSSYRSYSIYWGCIGCSS